MRHISFPLACLTLAPLGPVSSAAQESEAAVQPTGCHDISVGEWHVAYDPDPTRPNEKPSSIVYLLPDRIEFAAEDGDRRSRYAQITVPDGALPSMHSYASAWIADDTLRLSFGTGFSGISARLVRSGDGWAGTARTFVDYVSARLHARPIELRRVDCDSPPPISMNAMRPLARTVELEGGPVVTLGEPLPESLPTLPADAWSRFVVARTTGLFGTTDSIRITLRDSYDEPDAELVDRVELWYPPEDHRQFSARFRDVFGSPDEDATPHPSLALHWKNRITDLSLMVTHPASVDARTLVTLNDLRR